MEQSLSGYWWLVIPVVIAFLALLFSLERRSSKVKNIYPQNYIDGLKALIAGDEDDAFVKLKQAVADDTDNIDAYLKLGDLFRNRGQFEKAIRVHRELILRKSIKPDMASQVRKSLVTDYIQTKKYEAALEELGKLEKDSSNKNWASQKVIEVYERQGNWDKAFSISKSILKTKEQQKKLAAYKYLIGFNQYNNGEFHKARLAFKDAFHFDENFADSYIMIAESYLAENRLKDAVEFYRKLAEKAPHEFYRVSNKVEETLFSLGSYSEAEEIYKKILDAMPEETDILKQVAGIEEKKGNTRGAIESLWQAVEAHPGDGAASGRLMELYIKEDMPERAHELINLIKEKCQYNPNKYNCPYCNTSSNSLEMICANCGRVGPYKRV